MCEKSGIRLNWAHMVPAPYRFCFKLFNFFRSCKILFGLVKFKTAPDPMSGNVWEVFVNTELKFSVMFFPTLNFDFFEGQIRIDNGESQWYHWLNHVACLG